MDDQQVQIRVLFTKVDPDSGLSYTDSLYYDPDEYEKLSPDDLEAAKNVRFNNWLTTIKNPVLSDPVPIADQIAVLDEQIDQLTKQKDHLQVEAS